MKANLYMDARSVKKDGTCPIKINVRGTGKFLINTGVAVLPCNWDGGGCSQREPNYRAKNMRLREMMNKVEMVFYDFERKGGVITDKTLRAALERKLSGKSDVMRFSDVAEEFISGNKKPRTIDLYRKTIDRMNEFEKDVDLNNITVDWLRKFEVYLTRKGNRINSISIHMRNIRAVINYAIDNEYTTHYPFRRYKIMNEETIKRSLTIEELRRLINCDVEPHEERYRDLFVLMFYLIGINSIDVLNHPPLTNNKMIYRRSKTGKPIEIKIQQEAMEIINKYNGENYMLCFMDSYKSYKPFTDKMNRFLKEIASRINLPSNISTYWTRHTWATIAAELDIPKETIAAALGHSSRSVTDIYIRFDQKKIDEANRRVIDYVLHNNQ